MSFVCVCRHQPFFASPHPHATLPHNPTHHARLPICKQVAPRVKVGPFFTGGPFPQVKGIRKHGPRQRQPPRPRQAVHAVQQRLGHGVPRLIVLHVAVVGVVGAVRHAPPVVGHHDGGVDDVADKVVEGAVVGEGLVAAEGGWSGGRRGREGVGRVWQKSGPLRDLALGCDPLFCSAPSPLPPPSHTPHHTIPLTSRAPPQTTPRTWCPGPPSRGATARARRGRR